ncbi:hypothetical protein [Ancylomarina sp. 16SWW S1-10-2]|uniref:hypothetical protein n=1 Tax=Ancylomarina sp. 16SWW S1-10-2 TaxID=2499681 RepID=UPI0012AE0365|nr:hypothetical protein [Ancylomarina sp. 16SWW S1-10-2]MRT91444.1 hypothetical protein [Ancylomarina sp. 16SWW S1-10-2]
MKLVTKDATYLYNSFSKKINFLNQKNKTYWSGNVTDFRKAVTKIKTQTNKNFLLNDSSFLKNQNITSKDHLQKITTQKVEVNLLIPDYNIYDNFNIISTPNFTSVGEYIVRKYEIRNAVKLLEEIWIAENLLPHMGWDMSKFKDFLDVFFFHSGVAPYFNLNSYMKVRKNGLPLKVIIFHEKEKTIITMDHASKTKLNEDSFSVPENFILTTIDKILTPITN